MPQAPVVDAGAAPDAPAAKPDSQMAVIMFDSTPSGAEVFDSDKKSLGKTPLKLELPISDMPLSFELRLAGYRKKTKELTVRGNTMVQVPLDRAPPTNKGTGSMRPRPPQGSDTALERPD